MQYTVGLIVILQITENIMLVVNPVHLRTLESMEIQFMESSEFMAHLVRESKPGLSCGTSQFRATASI